jgi:hypothetical protein
MKDVTTPSSAGKGRSFDCPHCGAFARQYSGKTYWWDGEKPDTISTNAATNRTGEVVTNVNHMEVVKKFDLYKCEACKRFSIWIGSELVYPKSSQAPKPLDEMPNDVKRDFNEARLVVEDSPRSAAALLRLAIQRLLEHLDADGRSLHQQIGDLVEEGRISPRVQRALDSVRVVGNESVHPGVMDMDDDRETAIALFKLVNTIVDETLRRDRVIEDMYDSLPENKRKGIEDRDS